MGEVVRIITVSVHVGLDNNTSQGRGVETMNISDWEHTRNQEQIHRLKAIGYVFKINQRGYQVWFKKEYLGGVSVRGRKPMHWRYRDANLRNFLQAAIREAQKHEQN